jgi:hypothetical protein
MRECDCPSCVVGRRLRGLAVAVLVVACVAAYAYACALCVHGG